MKHQITWHSPDAVTKKVLDYSVSDSWLRQFVIDVRVRNSYFNSDHRLLVTKLKTPANKAARFAKRHIKASKKHNTIYLNYFEIRANFKQIIQEHINNNNSKKSLLQNMAIIL